MSTILEFRNVGKSFSGNHVLKDVSFKLEEGKILGLVGENGAGKSTMMNILFGMSFIKETGGYEGEVLIDGEVVNFNNPSEALEKGIGMVHQEFSLIPGFTASEDILLNREITKPSLISKMFGKNLSTLEREKMDDVATEAIGKLGLDISAKAQVRDMPVGHKQFIEIAREVSKEKVKLIILDEPTAVLTESEADILIAAMKSLAARGIAMIFISHRLREVIDVCDQIVVLRDGEIIKDTPNENVSIVDVASWMVGRSMDKGSGERVYREINTPPVMTIKNLYVDMPGEAVRDVSLEVREGEILGLCGLAGQGKLGIPNGVMGLYPAGGEVTYKGEKLDIKNTAETLKKRIAFVSEDRRGVGLLLDEGIDWNIAFDAMQVHDRFLKKVGPFKFRDDKAMEDETLKYIDELEIRTQGPKEKARNLSGGNQQKVCLAKAFAVEPEFLFVSEPTRGIDVGAKKLVLDALRKYNEDHGTTIVITSSELEELRSIADRIAVIFEGKVFGILKPNDPVEYFGLMMAGTDPKEVLNERQKYN
ncbi:MAG: sugar ABC transporter ATP-binding protein [Ezakiella sp.]|nr:sugar ABC transporter ATP-binding protein [Ezakiella sp.]MDD7761657.1 sugar ABC transporter ATP-binding protein [Bacillota bacterium]MDY3947487.1 sugar ABC transporter ATP-binding protein [Ezakiella sp.]